MEVLKSSVRSTVNRKLYDLTARKYFDAIPLDEIFAVIRDAGSLVLQEDGTEWNGLLCGSEGNCIFALRDSKHGLSLSWYRMPSGRYEIVTYVN